MNCMDFRRVSLEDPQGLSESATIHVQSCSACNVYYRQLLKQERLLERALNVGVPEDLVAHTLLRHGFEQKDIPAKTGNNQELDSTLTPINSSINSSFSWRRFATGFALVASIVAVTIGINVQQLSDPEEIARMLVSHIEEEAHTLSARDTVSKGRLTNTLSNVDIQQLAHLGDVTFAGNCLVDGKWAAHLVMKTEQGPVTVLLMPNSKLRSIDHLGSGGDRVQTVALRGGSMALIGSDRKELDLVRERVVSSVRIHHI